MAVIDVFNDRLKAEGHWVFAGGLGDPRDLLPRLGRAPSRRVAYDEAIELAGNTAETAMLHPPPEPA